MTLTYRDALAFIDALLSRERVRTATTETVKLRRVEALLKRLGDPHRRTPAVLIAGTKGKGSTAVMLASILQSSGRRVGLYTKPHLVDYRERFRIDGSWIEIPVLTDLVDRIRPHVEAMELQADGPPSYFEASVALAFLYFAQANVDLAIIEVGLGGRLDPTNIAEPVLSVLTPVSYDHMDVLGPTLAAIAREKAGIVRTGSAVASAPQPPEALAAIIDVCTRLRAKLWLVDELMSWRPVQGTLHDQTFELRGPWRDYGALSVPLVGTHQITNAATAVAAAEILNEQGFPLTVEAIRNGLASVRWPARVEVLQERPYVVADVAHNPASIGALRDTLEQLFPGHRIILVFGMVATHDHRASTSLLAPLADVLIATTPHHIKPLPGRILAQEAARYVKHVEVIDDRLAALHRALALAGPDDVVVVTGSFFLVGDLREAFLKQAETVKTE
jgi:dihydrofolate synthase/folylpolyglutamate synthase